MTVSADSRVKCCILCLMEVFMKQKEQRNLNITLKNEEEKKDEIVLSLSAVFRQLKRFVILWLCLSIIVAVLIPVGTAVFAADQHKNLTALVSFNYKGVEKGLDPKGNQFDVNSLKSPTVIEMALTSLGEDLTYLEYIRQGISIESVIPQNAIDQIIAYKSLFEQGNITATKELLATSYFPTQYQLTFNYSHTGFSGERAVEVFNTVLDCYRKYFFETYGFNHALGSAVTALDYTDYDYAEAIDIFSSNLSTLGEYVSNLSSNDKTRFRASSTGYSFADLSESISTIRDVDLDMISSYVTVNNVTKDKATLIDYYRLESLNRQKIIAQENLNVIKESIEKYEKDTIVIYGDQQDVSQYTQASAEYDSLIQQRINAQKTLSTCTQNIAAIQTRINALNGKNAASKEKVEKVEKDLANLNSKVAELLDKINTTANEYYETVYLANSYTILVPASSSALHTTKNILKSALKPFVIVEALLFVCYFGVAFVIALVLETREAKLLAAMEEEEESEEAVPSLRDVRIISPESKEETAPKAETVSKPESSAEETEQKVS